MKNIFKLLSIVILVFFIASLVGCGSGSDDEYIYFELSEKPTTLDPQTASQDSELLIIRNIYEGLLRKDENGEIVCAAAESYSNDGLTYTFKLKKGMSWSTGDALTAFDFVFAFRRAVSPETRAPFASRLFCISGAEAIYSGSASPDTLGVSAPDEETVIIKLVREDENFKNSLTSSVAMPCNEKFFNSCVGKYGLENSYVISNGSYSLTKWNKQDFGIRLYRNRNYEGSFVSKNAAVFFSCRDDEDVLEVLKDNNADMAFIESHRIGEAKNGGLKVNSYEDICWLMVIGGEYSADVRRYLAMAVSGDIYEKSLTEGFRAASSIYPEVLLESGVSADSKAFGVGITAYDLDAAKTGMANQISDMENKKFPSALLYYAEDPVIKKVITDIAGHWQQNLGVFLNIKEARSPEELPDQLINNTVSFAVFPVRAGASIGEYLKNFGEDYSGDAVSSQKKILSDNTVVPLVFETTNIASTKSIKSFVFDTDNGYVDFSFIVKKK